MFLIPSKMPVDTVDDIKKKHFKLKKGNNHNYYTRKAKKGGDSIVPNN